MKVFSIQWVVNVSVNIDSSLYGADLEVPGPLFFLLFSNVFMNFKLSN